MKRLAPHAQLMDVSLHLCDAAHLNDALDAVPFKLHDQP